MPSVVTPTVQIDMSGLNRSIEFAQQYSKRTPAEACNTAGLEIAIATKNAMPAVKVSTIDTQLALTVVPKIGSRGRPLKRGKVYSGGVGTARNPDVPLAALIVAARANPRSRYNQLTNNRYALGKNPFAGVSQAAGRAAMRALVDKMSKARRSSVNFLMAGWIPAVKTLRKFTSNRFRRFSGDPNQGSKAYFGADLGHADPAKANGYVAQCVIANDIGYEGKNRASFDRAQQTIGAPILQAKVDNEGAKSMQYYLDHSAAEMAKQFNSASA